MDFLCLKNVLILSPITSGVTSGMSTSWLNLLLNPSQQDSNGSSN